MNRDVSDGSGALSKYYLHPRCVPFLIFSCRVLANASVTRQEHMKLTEKANRIRSEIRSASEGTRAKLERELKQVDDQREELRKKLDGYVDELVASEFWPATKPGDFSNVEEKLSNLEKRVISLNTKTTSIDIDVQKYMEQVAGHRDSSHENSQGNKRRRISSATSSRDDGQAIEEYLAGISKLDERLSDLDNRLNENETIMVERFATEIDTTSLDKTQQRVEDLEKKVSELDQEVLDIINELTESVERHNEMQEQMNALVVENVTLRAKIDEVQLIPTFIPFTRLITQKFKGECATTTGSRRLSQNAK